MRKPSWTSRGNRGFSLVEMMVAMVFVLILMAGLAAVFKSSLTTFYTAGEKLSSVRRNRSTIDLLYDDINAIGLYLQDGAMENGPTGLGANQPPFYVLPNQVVSVLPNEPPFADQLFFYLDQPYQFQGKIATVGSAANANQAVQQGLLLSGISTSMTIDCGSYSYALQVANAFSATNPIYMTRQDSFSTWNLASVTAPAANSSILGLTTGSNPLAPMTGTGSSSQPPTAAPIIGAAVTFFQPAQMIRYSVQMLQLDPASAVGIPCLVRDQGNYDPNTFTPIPALQQVIAENVSAFRVYLSVNPGYLTINTPAQAWAPFAAPNAATLTTGWTNGIIADLNTQLATSGRTGATSIDTTANPFWFRNIPVVLRMDITTRTARQRTEYSNTTTPTLAYKTLTRSLVMIPRHFGLPLDYQH